MRLPVKAIAGASTAALALAAPFVAQWEGQRNDPYWDIAGVRSFCYGETRNVEERHYSSAECRATLRTSLAEHASGVRPCLPDKVPLEVEAAFYSFAYNVGEQAACGSTAVKRLRAGDVVGACNGLLMWAKARNPATGLLEASQGLANRRAAERALCLKGTPA